MDLRLRQTVTSARRAGKNAFTLVEVMMASAVAGLMCVSVLASVTSAFTYLRLDRENSRASQILVEKMEVIRLYTWAQITGQDTNTFVPSTFTAPFYPDSNNGGFLYQGYTSISNAPLTENYNIDMRLVTLTLTWKSFNIAHSNTISTYVSRYGVQNYIY
jgi:hypothetical protein